MTKLRSEVSGLGPIERRRKLLKQIKAWVHAYVGDETAALQKYTAPYEREFSGQWRVSDVDELFGELRNTNLVFGADFHGFSQAQRTHLRVLRSLKPNKSVVLGLEIFESRHQRLVDQFMAGQLTEKKFLEAIRWNDKWGFPWSQYKPLLDLAIKRRYKVLALNQFHSHRSGTTLNKRDVHAAKIISKAMKSWPDSLMYVIFGDLHLAESHLPRLVLQKAKSDIRHLVLFQNSERLYFMLAKKGVEQTVQVLRKQNRFCVLSSPPWVQWQSYLLFLEGSLDRDLGDDENEIDHTAHLNHLISIISSDFSFKIDSKDIAVYGPVDEGLSFAIEKRLSESELRVAKQMIAMGRSFFIPDGGIFYLANPTVNHAAALAGEYIQSRMSGRDLLRWQMPSDFRKLIWIEIIAFFLSKFVNHRRKTDRLQDIRVKAPHLAEEVLLLVLDEKVNALFSKMGRNRVDRRPKARQKASYFLAARLLGGLFGERMFLAYQSGFIPKADVVRLISQGVDDDKFRETYDGLIKKLEGIPNWARKAEKRL